MKKTDLYVKAFVEVPIYLSPRYVSFYGRGDKSFTRVVEIRAGLDRPLTLTPVQFNLEGKLTYKVEEIEKGRRFKVRFTSVPGLQQNYQGFLSLKTNYPEKPELNIRIRVRLKNKRDS